MTPRIQADPTHAALPVIEDDYSTVRIARYLTSGRTWSARPGSAGPTRQEMNWIARRWTEALSSAGISNRLSHGMSHVLDTDIPRLGISSREVEGVVSLALTHHMTRIRFPEVGRHDWEAVAEKIFAQPAAASQLSVGILPEGTEEIFQKAGLSLIPKIGDLAVGCTCGSSDPCDHIRITLFTIAAMLDDDPFSIFVLRGASIEDLMKMAGLVRMPNLDRKREERWTSLFDPHLDRLPSEPIPDDPGKFWGQDPGAYDFGHVLIPIVHAALPKHLGAIPDWKGSGDFIREMEETYSIASQAGMSAFLGEAEGRKRGRGSAFAG